MYIIIIVYERINNLIFQVNYDSCNSISEIQCHTESHNQRKYNYWLYGHNL